jgi:quercetin dioxygenase-like cupin family protein
MAYKSSPRPVFTDPTVIKYANLTRHLWGDEESGRVDDWIYASTSKIHQLVFGVAGNRGFKHSDSFRTVFGADEIMIVLSGLFGCVNPETGEVRVVKPGEAVFFRKDTWHHGFALDAEPLRVLEYFAPPPSTGTSGAYAKTKPYVAEPTYLQKKYVGHWPMAQDEEKKAATMHHLREADLLWSLDTNSQGVLTGYFVATEHLTSGRTTIQPGSMSNFEAHGGDECLYVERGVLNVLVEIDGVQSWYEVHPKDGFFLPEGARHRYANTGGEPVHFYFGVAPRYTV